MLSVSTKEETHTHTLCRRHCLGSHMWLWPHVTFPGLASTFVWQCASAHFRLIRCLQRPSKHMTPQGQRSGNSKSTPPSKGKAQGGAKTPKTGQGPLRKTPRTPLTKGTPKTSRRGLPSTGPLEDAQLSRTRRKRGGTHMKRDGPSGYISSSVTSMFMWSLLHISTDCYKQPS